MAVNTYHLRSSVKGKEPTAGTATGQLPVGSIAINYHQDEPFLSIQDSAGQVRRIAGVKVDTTAPTSATTGEFWLDTSGTDKILKIFDGAVWVATGTPVVDATTAVKGVARLADAAAVTAGTAGRVVTADQLKTTNDSITTIQGKVTDASETAKGIVELATAAETTTGTDNTRAVHPAGLKVELDKKAPDAPDGTTDGTTQYVRQVVRTGGVSTKTWTTAAAAGSSVTVSDTAPTGAATGDLWWDSKGGQLYVYYTDANSSQWVQASPQAPTPTIPDATTTVKGIDTKLWGRTGTTLSPATAGDSISTTGVTLNAGAATSPLVRDALGRLLVGTTSSTSNDTLVLQGASAGAGAAPLLRLRRGSAITGSGNGGGRISFGDLNQTEACLIDGIGDGSWTGSSTPGRLEFHTTPSGSNIPVERMRIQSNGQVSFVNITALMSQGDNNMSIGNATNRWSAVYAANGTIQTSDQRAKADVADAALGADFIKSLRPVSYKWIEGGKADSGKRDEHGNWILESVPGERTHWGFIAQEVKQAVDAAGVDFGGWVLTDKDDPNSQQALRYDQFIAPLTKALQEALVEIDMLKGKVAALEGGSPMKDDSPRSKTRR